MAWFLHCVYIKDIGWLSNCSKETKTLEEIVELSNQLTGHRLSKNI